MNAADVGNYHAGYTGTIAGVPATLQYTLAWLGKIKKNAIDNHNFGSALERFAQQGVCQLVHLLSPVWLVVIPRCHNQEPYTETNKEIMK